MPEYGDPEKDKVDLKELSPITYIDQIKAPLMIVQGVNDPRVPVGEALQSSDACRAAMCGLNLKRCYQPRCQPSARLFASADARDS